VFRLPPAHRVRLRTTKMLEHVHRELKRRTRVATLFPNDASLLRLTTAVLMELSEDWETGKRYVTFRRALPPCSSAMTTQCGRWSELRPATRFLFVYQDGCVVPP
jgi:transposase-like protein